MLKLDIGCGNAKRPDFIGVDIDGNPDVVCDIAREQLPFDDASADHILSSHCFEHIQHNSLLHVFQEMTRVAADGAVIEIWHPHAFHSDAFVVGHVNYLSESIYSFMACLYRSFATDHWFGGIQWILEEVRYNVEPFVLADMKQAGIDYDFSVSYLHDVIKEIGIFVRVNRSGVIGPNRYRRFICHDRDTTTLRLSDGPRNEAIADYSEVLTRRVAEIERYAALTASIAALRDMLALSDVRLHAMEQQTAQQQSATETDINEIRQALAVLQRHDAALARHGRWRGKLFGARLKS